MVTTTSLALSGARELTPSHWQMFREMAPVMHRSRLFGVSSEEATVAIMLKGYELGLSITASFEFVQVIEGKPTLSPRGALALLHNSPEIELIEVKRLENNNAFVGYQCHMKRRNGFEFTSRFTLDDARRAGLTKARGAWEAYPENMCLWRAIGFAADMVAPDITAGMTALMKMPEQYGVGLSEAGDVIDITPTPAPVSAATPTPAPAPVPAITLDELLERWTAEQILVANEGKIPGTDDELRAVAAKLGAA
jgi:hypothetical protein